MTLATEDDGRELQALTMRTLMQEIEKYKDGHYKDADGNPIPVPAALLAQAINFQKLNKIDRFIPAADPTDTLDTELEAEFRTDIPQPGTSRFLQ